MKRISAFLQPLVAFLLSFSMIFALFSCSGGDDTESNPHTHSYVNGACECGEADPSYTPPHEHTFIDGVCGCEASDPNYVSPHRHIFVDGRCE